MIRKAIFFIILPFYYLKADITIETVWGTFIEKDSFVEEIINSKVIKRIKEIDQSGIPAYYKEYKIPKFSRYEHCVGVYLLLKQKTNYYKKSIAGLLHHVSHTAFSHVGDHLFYISNQK